MIERRVWGDIMGCYGNSVVALGIDVLTGCASAGFRQVSITAGDVMDGAFPMAGQSVFVVWGCGPAGPVLGVDTRSPAATRTESAPNGATLRTVYPEHMEHPDVLSLKNSIAVLISASDAKHFRETGQVKSLWKGEASIPGKPELLRKMVPYLLTPTLKYFGKSSGGLKLVDGGDNEIKRWPAAR